ncbi:MAG TPA: limonene-1,2-epoxide hydrolase family protein [Dehalococcoidia bacterium]|nr:limonene-1,2-epoxide hydrolase family protein [Dehalococcoidia bacterium]
MSDALQTVQEFCAAWSKLDAELLLGYFAEDAVYHNIPMQPMHGREAIGGFLRRFTGQASAAQFEMLHIAASGDTVLTERIDRFTLGERRIALPVMGVFELRDGKIAAWRDYFDLTDWQKQSRG